MNEKKQRPDGAATHDRGDNIPMRQDKGNISLSKRQRKVYNLLCTGKHSAADISIQLGYSDPRSYIRDLREKGVIIHDEWVENEDTRYKRYWA
jgi:hypothetical protein